MGSAWDRALGVTKRTARGLWDCPTYTVNSYVRGQGDRRGEGEGEGEDEGTVVRYAEALTRSGVTDVQRIVFGVMRAGSGAG